MNAGFGFRFDFFFAGAFFAAFFGFAAFFAFAFFFAAIVVLLGFWVVALYESECFPTRKS
jgi:hypothetical protein